MIIPFHKIFDHHMVAETMFQHISTIKVIDMTIISANLFIFPSAHLFSCLTVSLAIYLSSQVPRLPTPDDKHNNLETDCLGHDHGFNL